MSYIFLNKTTIYFIIINIVFTSFSFSQDKNIKKEKFDCTSKDCLVIFEKYLWFRDKNDRVKINKKTFKAIYKNTKSSEGYYFEILQGYSIFLSSEVNKIVGKKLSFPERAYVHAYALEYLYKCQEKFKENDPYRNQVYVSWVLNPRNRNAYNKEFKKNNYYCLRRLKENHIKHFRPSVDPKETKLKPLSY